jgi:hypothetical protein
MEPPAPNIHVALFMEPPAPNIHVALFMEPPASNIHVALFMEPPAPNTGCVQAAVIPAHGTRVGRASGCSSLHRGAVIIAARRGVPHTGH